MNPATEEVTNEYDIESREKIDERISNARRAFAEWKETTIGERTTLLKRMGKKLLANKQKYAEIMAKEMGKPVKEGMPEIEKCAFICEYYANNAKRFLRDESVKTEYKKSYVTFEPLGVIASIMPWNFPFSQPFRFAVPALVGGNVLMLKHSSTVPQCSLAIEELFNKCKFPENVFQSVIGDASTGTMLVESDINAVSLTGSTDAGSRVAQIAAKGLKKVVLELGGSDPFIVLEDADMDKTVAGGVVARFHNCGQSCIAAKRFIVVKSRLSEFTEKFVEKAKNMVVGDPLDPNTDMGPMVNSAQRDRLEAQIKDTLAAGAKLLLGGRRPERKGYFFEPTVLANVTNSMRIAQEEAFGPAAPIIAVDSEDEAIKVANDTEYGLGASIWTEDLEKAEALAKKITAGLVFVNRSVRSDPRYPFGGAKKSGIGRELGRYGLLEMLNIKTVIIN